jgi:hypothetical protein
MAALAPRLLRSPEKGGKPGSRGAILYLTSGCVKLKRDGSPIRAQLGAASAEYDRDLVLGYVAGFRLELEIRGYETARAL